MISLCAIVIDAVARTAPKIPGIAGADDGDKLVKYVWTDVDSLFPKLRA